MNQSMMKQFTLLEQPLVFKYMNEQHTFTQHLHENSFMIGTPLEGRSTFMVEFQKYEIGPNELCVIPPYFVHSCTPFKNTSSWKFLTLHPSVALFQTISDSMHKKPLHFSFEGFFFKDKELCENLTHIVKTTLANENIQESKVREFLRTLLTKHGTFSSSQTVSKNEKFEPLFEYLKTQEYCLKHLDFYKMAHIMKMNPFYFHRLFSKTIGLTPQTFINALRLSKAKQMLSQSDSLAQVALKSGFYDQAYFTKQFKKYHGITPTLFKQIP